MEQFVERPGVQRCVTGVALGMLEERTDIDELVIAPRASELVPPAVLGQIVLRLVAVLGMGRDVVQRDIAAACAGLEMQNHGGVADEGKVAGEALDVSGHVDLFMLELSR